MPTQANLIDALIFLTGERMYIEMAVMARMVALYGDDELMAVDEMSVAPAFPTSRIAEVTGMTSKAAYAALNKMAKAGLVVRSGGGGGHDAYWTQAA